MRGSASGGSALEARDGCRWLGAKQCNVWWWMQGRARRFPSLLVAPTFSVRQRSSNTTTRVQLVASSQISSISASPLTSRGVPPPSSLLEGSSSSCAPLGRVPPPSCLIASPSLGTSASSSVAPTLAGNVDGVETSLGAAMMLDQQLTTAFQTGLRHSLDDSDHDAMSDLSGKRSLIALVTG